MLKSDIAARLEYLAYVARLNGEAGELVEIMQIAADTIRELMETLNQREIEIHKANAAKEETG